jgi:restriction system protein
MTGAQFERYVGQVFYDNGHHAAVTKISGDHGVDLVLNGYIAVQVKCYSSPVGQGAIQEVVAGKAIYKCTEAWVVTNSTFTPAAVKLAEANGVRLIAGKELQWLADNPDPSSDHRDRYEAALREAEEKKRAALREAEARKRASDARIADCDSAVIAWRTADYERRQRVDQENERVRAQAARRAAAEANAAEERRRAAAREAALQRSVAAAADRNAFRERLNAEEAIRDAEFRAGFKPKKRGWHADPANPSSTTRIYWDGESWLAPGEQPKPPESLSTSEAMVVLAALLVVVVGIVLALMWVF